MKSLQYGLYAGLTAFVLGCGVFVSQASDIQLGGATSWVIYGQYVNIEAEEVDNNDAEGVSGTVRLQVWATDMPYDGSGPITGHVLGTMALDPLEAGLVYYNISDYVPYSPPPVGSYYTTITAEEWTGDEYAIRDWRSLDYATLLGGSNAVGNGVVLSGTPKFRISKTRGVRLKVQDIFNYDSAGSGPLRVDLWACPLKYSGGTLDGHLVATTGVGSLPAGQRLNKIHLTAPFSAPPAGQYYMILVLWEQTNDGWEMRGFYQFPKLKPFR